MAKTKTEKKVTKPFWEMKKGEQMANAYVKGATMKELAAKYGISMGIVSKTLKYFHVESHPRGPRSTE